ncbi:MAG: peptidylprolyl isomerase [Alphaproteobacteria bacterium]|jgi:peptidylprolyl isomerase|nr:peptidylprolyl isomerase [Alphaproteobacteria bacterium]
MLVKLAKVFVCFFILIMTPVAMFAADEAADTTAATEAAPVAPAAIPMPSSSTTPPAANTDTGIADSVLNGPNSVSRRTPVVSMSEISNAIDDNYSFLYDPNMKPELIKDLHEHPDNYVVMYLETGDAILIKLREDLAPNTVIRFRQLVQDKFYDDMEIFRAIPDFLAQMGDPSGSGFGGKGVFYFAEINPDVKFVRGTVAMSNNGNLQSDDTQFFITFNSFPWLDGKYTVFGEVVLGMPRLENINKSLANDGFVTDPAIVTQMVLLSDRPTDRIDDLSILIPVEVKEQAQKTQQDAHQAEQNRQQARIEMEAQQQALADANNAANAAAASVGNNNNNNNQSQQNNANNALNPDNLGDNTSLADEDASIEDQAADSHITGNPYLRPQR